MNFFYGINNSDLSTSLTVPRFQNSGKTHSEYKVYKAEIKNYKWDIQHVNCKYNHNFYFIDSSLADNDNIFFLAKEREVKQFEKDNYSKLLDLNTFTNTHPEFRANLQIFNKNGGFSSFQSEYPYSMVVKQGSILTPVSTICNKDALINCVFIKNIYTLPIKEKFNAYLVNATTKKICNIFSIYTNCTNEIVIDNKLIDEDIYIYTDDYLGIPVYVSTDQYNISMEHTHPPHEYIKSKDCINMVKILKKEFHEIIH